MITRTIHPTCRGSNGQLISGGNWSEGFELTPECKAKIRIKATQRATTEYRHIKVNGVLYPNLTRASKVTGISPRSLGRYANSDKYPNIQYV